MAIATEEPTGRGRGKTIAVFRDLWRPATVVLLLVPVSVFSGGTSTRGLLAAAAMVAALALVAAALVAVGILPFQRSYLWLVLLAGLLLVSFAFPAVMMPVPMAEQHRIVDFVGTLRGLTAMRLIQLTDLAGLLAGLALSGVGIALSPYPRHVARVIVLTGAVAAGYLLLHGGYSSGRLEGLGCNANYLGILLALPFVAAVGLVRYARNLRWLVPAAVCFVALTDTQSRGAFLAAVAGVVFVFGQGHSWRSRALLVFIGAALGVGALATGLLPSLGSFVASLGAGDRTTTDLSATNGVRVHVAHLAVHVIMEHPLRGIGYRMFPAYAAQSPDFHEYLNTHNEFLRLGAEAGVLTPAVFLVLLWLGTRHRRVRDLAVLRAVVVTYAAALLFANPMSSLVISAPFWVALGCLLNRASRTGTVPTVPPAPTVPAIMPADEVQVKTR
jgi:hypothetical protein